MKRPLRLFFHASGATLSLAASLLAFALVGLLLGLWLWVRADGSIDQALRLGAMLLPQGQSLQSSDARGSIAGGGRVGHLLWTSDAHTVELQDLELAWDWHALLDGELRIGTLHIAALHVRSRGAQAPDAPGTTPMPELVWPLRVDLHFAVDQLDWAGPATAPVLPRLQQLQGRYRYDGQNHVLQDASVHLAEGRYQAQGQLQARSPMALSLQLQGTVPAPLALARAVPTLLADASAQGTLRGPDAQVEVKLALQPRADSGQSAAGAMQARLQALIRPTQAQPIAQAQASWSALDLARLWPQAPHTRLSGQAQVLPDAQAPGGWTADIVLQNALPGSLDQQRLPLRAAHAEVLYRDGQWLLSALQAGVAGGTLQAQGRYAGSPAQWSAQGSLQGIEPAQWDARWRGPALHGDFSAQQAGQGVAFDAQLGTPLAGPGAGQMTLQAKGLWSAPLLQLDTLELQTPQATLSGHGQLDTQTYASALVVQAKLPGAQLAVDGNAAPTAGQGSASLQVSDTHALLQWLATLPVLGDSVQGADAQGALALTARWSGGWQNLGEALQVQATLQSQRLDLPGPTLLRGLQLDLAGTLRALALQLRGQLQRGGTQLALQAQSHGGQVAAGQWQARLDSLQLQASSALYAKPWTMDLEQAVALEWRSSALAQSFALAAGSLRLGGPAPGTASLQWQPVQWTQPGGPGATQAARWATQGQLQGLPLAWLELLGQTQLANLGLRGDLLLGGKWEARGGEALQLRASLQRTSGDLQLLSTEQAGAVLPAGLREARVALEIDNNALRATGVWASEAGGNAQAEFSTRLQTVNGHTQWAPDAPLQGRLQAKLPRVGAWSLVAPVGWRIQGTLDADAVLSGYRSKPVWQGSLEARDMAVRSVVDGLDFSQGVMRLVVNGQHMDIAELTLRGAGGAAGGQLNIGGTADWLAAAGGSTLAQRLRIVLDAKAQAFRVSARADQRLVVSGNLNAQLVDARLQVRGALVADQALLVLPDDTAPKLGTDVVVVRKAAAGTAPPARSAPVAAGPLAMTVVPDISVTLDPGRNFMLQGHGLRTRLAGLLTLKAEGVNARPRLQGELRAVAGTYRAYGQNLNIEEGTLRFNGAFDNPTLAILALRPNLSQEVGVQISGTAQLPVVRLYANPDMPDADKLSWLVLGHAPSGSGGADTALLQQAALALLSGNGQSPTQGLFNALGLDEVSVGQTATTNLDGSSGTEATVKLGKRISRDFYVAFERSLSGTMGTFYVFYDLSRRFTLRAESGEQGAVDLIFTTRFD